MSINEGLWSAKLPNGDVRSGTLGQLNEAFRAGHLGESTLVCAAGSTNWIRLADVLGGAAAFSTGAPSVGPQPASQPPPPGTQPMAQPVGPVTMPVNGGGAMWQVKLANGEVRSGTRQQLEEAFRSGHLDGSALVLAPGSSEWSKVGILLTQSQPPISPVPSAHPPAPSIAPQSVPPAIASPSTPSQAANGSSEPWQVRLPNGQVRSGTRKQLEEAFNAGHLDDSAPVLPAGSSEWVRLGDLMDRRSAAPVTSLEPTPSVEAPTPTTAPEPPPMTEAAPAADSAPMTLSNPAAAVVDGDPTPGTLPESDSDEASSWEPAPTPLPSVEVRAPEPLWQVKLTLKQLQDGFDARLFDDQTPVLATGADEWTPLGDVRRAQPTQEPASRTQPWPATAGANRASPPGE